MKVQSIAEVTLEETQKQINSEPTTHKLRSRESSPAKKITAEIVVKNPKNYSSNIKYIQNVYKIWSINFHTKDSTLCLVKGINFFFIFKVL